MVVIFFFLNLFFSLRLYSQKYIEEKAGADERDIWAKTHIGKGFVGKSYINVTLEILEDPC